jgi:hypothetical protein
MDAPEERISSNSIIIELASPGTREPASAKVTVNDSPPSRSSPSFFFTRKEVVVLPAGTFSVILLAVAAGWVVKSVPYSMPSVSISSSIVDATSTARENCNVTSSSSSSSEIPACVALNLTTLSGSAGSSSSHALRNVTAINAAIKLHVLATL